MPDLSIEQQVSLTSGSGFWHTRGIPEAGVPEIMVTDGPHGLRKQLADGTRVPATCFPPAVTLASSWDPGLVRRVGEAIGAEARAEGVSVVLGPGVNIKRSPLCGRNFEYYSEDPFLSGRLGAAFVAGVQSRGVGASVKHFAANNQETDRLRVSADVDERTLREIYLPAFEHVVTVARPAAVMAAYNRLNGIACTRHHWLLTEVLRGEWGFTGVVVSDWGATGDRVAALAAGLDLEMPPGGRDAEVAAAVREGLLPAAALEAAAGRVADLARATAPGPGEYDADEHDRLAREAAAAGMVLLRDDDRLLPLDPAARVAVIGEFARTPRIQGGGSSRVEPTMLHSALAGMRVHAGDRLTFAPGFTPDGVPDAALVAEAAAAAGAADVAVVFLGLPDEAESEGHDREHLDLPADQLALLEAVYGANPATVVVLTNGGAVTVAGWERHAAALLEGWLPGQAGGLAVADVLYGAAEPGGRLTETIPLLLSDTPAHLFFPGGERHVRYGEGLYVGYRHYDTLDRPVAYPFGHGLGYAEIGLAGLAAEDAGDGAVDVTAELVNTGERAGSQVLQVYAHDVTCSVDRPVHELKGFAKVRLEPGESRRVTVRLDVRAFAFWSVAAGRWKAEPGTVEIRAGFSSRDIRARVRVEHPGDGVPEPPLDASNTLDEWLADPVGGPLIGPLVPVLPARRRRMVGALPLATVAAFGAFLDAAGLERLLAAYAEARV